MARYLFGGDLTALAVDTSGNVQAGVTLTAWNAQTGGTKYTDLTDTLGTALPSGNITTDANGYYVFFGPNTGLQELWIAPPTGPRKKLITADLVSIIGAAQTTANNALAKGVPTNATPDLVLGHDGSVPLWRTLAAAGIVATAKGVLYGVDGRKYMLLSGTIRNTGTGWAFVNDSVHQPSNFGAITIPGTNDRITVAYAATALKVSSLQVTPDETFAAMGLRVGASVGTGSVDLYLYTEPWDRISDRVFYNGSAWVSENGVFTGLSYSAGVLTLTHESMGTAKHSGAAIAMRGTSGAFAGALADTTTQVVFYSGAFESIVASGAASSTKHNCYVTRYGKRAAANVPPVDPATIVSSSGNLWLTGLIEV